MISRSILVLSLIFSSAATIVVLLLSPTLSFYFTKSTRLSFESLRRQGPGFSPVQFQGYFRVSSRG